MKKFIWIVTAVLLLGVTLSACGTGRKEAAEGKISIVTTIFPEYDWVRELTAGSSDVEITMLYDKGVDLHSFQPAMDDMVKIADCDLLIYVGGESDAWIEEALEAHKREDRVVIKLLDVLGDAAKEEELAEGMEEEEEEHGEEEGPEYDEHVWLSLKNARLFCNAITEKLVALDGAHKDIYESNVAAFGQKLTELDEEYAKAVSSAKLQTLLFGDRFPFRYLVDDYGLKYYAAFLGCSSESEAGFETIAFLAEKTDDLGLLNILILENSDGKIARAIIDCTRDKNQNILTMNAMQSVSSEDVEQGISYLSVMKQNLEVLKKALE